MSARVIVLLMAVAAVGIVVGSQLHHEPTAQAQMAGGGFKGLTLVLEGNYRVNCSCAYNDQLKSSQDLKEELVKRIEFHPEYIVLINQYNGGRVIPVYAIKTFTWEPT